MSMVLNYDYIEFGPMAVDEFEDSVVCPRCQGYMTITSRDGQDVFLQCDRRKSCAQKMVFRGLSPYMAAGHREKH